MIDKDTFKLGNRVHDKVVKMIRDRIDFSYRDLSQRFSDWDTAEEHYRAWRPIDDEDLESLAKNQVQKIIVPIQFATLQVILTFMMEVFTALKPVLRTKGTDPASIRPARVMELFLDYDYRGNRGYFMLHQWFLNCFRYGHGIISNSWGSRQVLKRILKPGPSVKMELDGQTFMVPGADEFMNDYFTTFEGNKWEIVDNRAWFRDPRLPLSRFQEGEFCGKRNTIHDNELRKLEDNGIFFNTKDIKSSQGMGQTRSPDLGFETSSRDKISPEKALSTDLVNAKKNRTHVNEEIIIELVPKDYDLDDEERPQQWIFNLIDGTTVVRAEPNPFYQFNYSVIETFPDILASMSQGIMELSEPLAAHLSFLFNSHSANVRKAINDMFLFDPSRIDVRDILEPTAGKLIRLLPLAYGTDPSTAFKQLQVTDVTQGHILDSKALLDLWNRVLGPSDSMYGVTSASRKTATEMQGLNRMSAGRMKMLADLMSSEGVAPLTELMAITRQESMSAEQFIEIGGRTAAELGIPPDMVIDGFAKFRKDHINGVFEYPAEEGVLPQDRAKATEMFQKLFEAVIKVPFLTNTFDPIEIFKETVRQGGIHNIDDFLRKGVRGNVAIMRDAAVHELRARGKIEPYGGGNGGERGRPDQGIRESQEGLDVKGAIEGAGIPSE